ncbi:hypothetical protein [Streptomyces cellostaticus]|uniref:hypothetical protein n=1 Tax=Streptomyces cellostaticus TaxID=67285 RepID=UPI002026800B|nr:hypothetical protein [Streptomyces cellostaticus]
MKMFERVNGERFPLEPCSRFQDDALARAQLRVLTEASEFGQVEVHLLRGGQVVEDRVAAGSYCSNCSPSSGPRAPPRTDGFVRG